MSSTGSTRLKRSLDSAEADGRKSMGIFLTCGFPQLDATLPLLQAIDRAGADFIEVGMPFSDPLAEGGPIQNSSAIALANGTTLAEVLAVVRAFRTTSETPVVLMGYANPVYHFGVDRFCAEAAAAGVDGLILPDLPIDEAEHLRRAAAANGIDVIFLIAPNTPDERVRSIDRVTTGFVYAVAFAGLTGDTIYTGVTLQRYLDTARRLISNRLLVGFGIKSADDAAIASVHADGFIVGSALISHVQALWDDHNLTMNNRISDVEAFVRNLRPPTRN